MPPPVTRRLFSPHSLLHSIGWVLVFTILVQSQAPAESTPEVKTKAATKPNVIIILTDDQGFGELGATGNPVVHTPNIDRLAKQSVSLLNFQVMPVCSPTRAGLMTGRYCYRTGVTDTYLGRSLMDPAEITVAEMFAGAGYRTGIFGKWHLGDTYPRRAMDKGFQESLVLNGGGLAQPGDPPDPADERGAYFNATLRHNGTWIKTQGYVSDVLTDAAIKFIKENHSKPFFVYLPFNCPHAPHQISADYSKHYPSEVFDATNFPASGHPMAVNHDSSDLARVYGMIENIDDNVGKLLAKLDELKLTDNTIVILFSDNGCQKHNGYNAGFQGWKGSTYEGGIHQFCYLRWPAEFQAGREVDRITSHIDITPTLIDLCGVSKPSSVKFDGVSLAPLLRGETNNWPDRDLFAQWHRGDVPQRYRNFAVRSQDWKLVKSGKDEEAKSDADQDGESFQLYDMAHDPLEMHDVAAENPAQVARLKTAYDAWFDDLNRERDFSKPQVIDVGTGHENPVLLTRQDWRGPDAGWSAKAIGYWDLKIATEGHYSLKLLFDPPKSDGIAQIKCCGVTTQMPIKAGDRECLFDNLTLPAGNGRLEATLHIGNSTSGIKYAEMSLMP